MLYSPRSMVLLSDHEFDAALLSGRRGFLERRAMLRTVMTVCLIGYRPGNE